jgi:hypothetical protein
MKAIFINSETREITYIDNAGDLGSLYLTLNCDMVQIGDFNQTNGDTLWVDEEGLLKEQKYGFVYKTKEFVGSGVIYGSNIGGDNVSARSTIDDVAAELLFYRFETPETNKTI